MAWHPDGIRLAAIVSRRENDRSEIRIWDSASFDLIQTIELDDSFKSRFLMAWSSDGSRLAVVGQRGFIGILDAASGQLLGQMNIQYNNITRVFWKDNDHLISSLQYNGLLFIFDVTTGQIIAEQVAPYEIRDIALDPTRTRIATANNNGTISIWQE